MRRSSLLLSWILTLGACSPASTLLDVPLVGGTDEQREMALVELSAFDEWVGPGSVVLSKVEFTDLPFDEAGRYLVGPQRIELSNARQAWHVRNDLRHELCHAFDRQWDLASVPVPILDGDHDALVAYLQELSTEPGTDTNSVEAVRRETLALLCERGPFAAQVLTQSGCEDVPMAQRGDWLQRNIWTQAPSLGRTETDSNSIPATLADHAFAASTRLKVLDTLSGGVVEVDAQEPERAFVVATGQRHDHHVTTTPTPPSQPTPEGLARMSTAALSGGETLSVVDVDLTYLGRSEPAWLTWDEEADWQLLDGCGPGLQAAFAHDERLWRAWLEGPELTWQPLVP